MTKKGLHADLIQETLENNTFIMFVKPGLETENSFKSRINPLKKLLEVIEQNLQ